VPLGAALGFTVASMWLDHYFHSHGGGNSHNDAIDAAVACLFGLALGGIFVPLFVAGGLRCRSHDPAPKRVGQWLIVSPFGLTGIDFHLAGFFLTLRNPLDQFFDCPVMIGEPRADGWRATER